MKLFITVKALQTIIEIAHNSPESVRESFLYVGITTVFIAIKHYDEVRFGM